MHKNKSSYFIATFLFFSCAHALEHLEEIGTLIRAKIPQNDLVLIQENAQKISQIINSHPKLINEIFSFRSQAFVTENINGNLLHLAIIYNRPWIVALLIEKGAMVASHVYIDDYQSHFTPLGLATVLNRIAVVEVLLDKGADIYEGGQRGTMKEIPIVPLHEACEHNFLNLVAVLIERGTHLRTTSERSPLVGCKKLGPYTVLDIAFITNNTELARYLLSTVAFNPDFLNWNNTECQKATSFSRTNDLEH